MASQLILFFRLWSSLGTNPRADSPFFFLPLTWILGQLQIRSEVCARPYSSRWTTGKSSNSYLGNGWRPPQLGWPGQSASLCQPGLGPDELGPLAATDEQPRSSIRLSTSTAGRICHSTCAAAAAATTATATATANAGTSTSTSSI